MAREVLFRDALPVVRADRLHGQTQFLVLLLRPPPLQSALPQTVDDHLVLLLAEGALHETRSQDLLPPVHALRIGQIMAPHVYCGNSFPITKTDGFHRRTQLLVLMFGPPSLRRQSRGLRRAPRLGRLWGLIVDRLLLLSGLLLFGGRLPIHIGHLRIRYGRRLEHGHGARRQHGARGQHLGARRRVEAEEHQAARARGRAYV